MLSARDGFITAHFYHALYVQLTSISTEVYRITRTPTSLLRPLWPGRVIQETS